VVREAVDVDPQLALRKGRERDCEEDYKPGAGEDELPEEGGCSRSPAA
jgi:hypothetical protein